MADGYTITAQHQASTIDQAGGLRDVMVVSFATPEGATGSVRVPLESYDAATVDAMIRDRAAAMSDVAAL